MRMQPVPLQDTSRDLRFGSPLSLAADSTFFAENITIRQMRTSGTMKILIADNDRVFVRECCRTLDGRSCVSEICTAHSGTQCLDVLKDFSPTAVFLGVDLARMNGLVTARFIRSQYSRFPLFYLADRIPHSVIQKLDDGIVDGYFSKQQFTFIIKDAAALRSLTTV